MDPAIQVPDPKPFETLISDLMSSSNEIRSKAESQLNLCKKTRPKILVAKLGNLLEHSPHLRARGMSAILLPNLFEQEYTVGQSLWSSLSQSTRESVKNGLLKCVVNKQNKLIINILANTISKLVNDWPKLLPFIFNWVASEDFWLQESALLILAQLAQYMADNPARHIEHLHGVFMKCLGNVVTADVRIAAMNAVINFIQCLKSSSDRDRFQDLLPCMMQCLSEALNDGNEAMAQKALILLIELAGMEPMFFTGQLVEVVEGMLQIAEAESLEEGTRHLAIEFVVTLAEARGIMRKLLQFINRLFAILMRMLLDIEDEAAWHSAESDEDEDAGESSSYSVGQECLYRLAIALGEDIVPVAYDHEQLHAYLAAPNREWQEHLAALIALAQIAKGSSKVEIPNLEQVVTIVLKSFRDPHPRVRWAAINAIGHLSTYVGPSLQDQYNDRVLPALYLALYDVKNPRVQARAVSVVLHVSSHSPNLDGIILNKLIVLPLTSPIIQVLKLVNSLEESTDVQIRASKAVQLGKMFEKPLVVLTLDLVQRKLLTCVEKEDNRIVMKSLCHTIATFFNELCIKIGWPELISSVERWALGDNDLLKEAAMLILGSLRVVDMGVDLVPWMRRVLTEGLNEGKEETTQEALKLLIEWAHQIKHPRFSGLLLSKLLMPHGEYFLDYLVRSAVKIAKSQSLKKETRHLAIDFVTLVEGRAYISGVDIYVNRLFEILMLMLSDIENEAPSLLLPPSHSAENEGDDAGESRNYSVLLTFLDRLAFKLHGNSVVLLVLEQYLAAYEWQKRVAAIVALAQISKVLKRVVTYGKIGSKIWRSHTNQVTQEIFDRLVTRVLVLFQDSHPRVRLAAINATVQLSTYLDSDWQLQYHRGVLPALTTAIYDNPDPHVRLAAINATVQLSIDLGPNLQFQYNSHVLPALAKAICDFKYPQVQELAVSAVINVRNNFISIIKDNLLSWTPYLIEIVDALLEFRRRDDSASYQTRSLAIKDLVKLFPPGTWSQLGLGFDVEE